MFWSRNLNQHRASGNQEKRYWPYERFAALVPIWLALIIIRIILLLPTSGNKQMCSLLQIEKAGAILQIGMSFD